MATDKLVLRRRGEDGHKIFSVRIKESLVDRLDEVAAQTNRSRNEIVASLLEYGLDHLVIEEKEE